MSKKVFLGGTCNGSDWRDKLIPMLKIESFNPVVANWTEECMKREIEARETSDYCLYVLTPKMTGVYSVAEVVDDSNKRSSRTVLVVLDKDGDDAFNPHQQKSLNQVKKMVEKNGAKAFGSLEEVAAYLNS